MAIVPNIVNMVSGINQRKRQGRVRDAMGNYLDDPETAIESIMRDDPQYAQALIAQRRQSQMQDEDRARSLFDNSLTRLRGLDPTQQGAAIDAMSGQLRSGGMTDEGLANLRSATSGPGNLANRMDDNAWEAQVQREMTPYTIQGGQQRMVGDQEIAQGQYKRQIVEVPRADGGVDMVLFDPNRNGGEFITEGGQPASPEVARAARRQMEGSVQADFDREFGGGDGQSSASMTVDGLREHFIAQESSGDYTAVNPETGALGAYQVMPATARTLAERLGMPWRPQMMRGNSPEARAYQDRIGGAAIQEAIDASGGDPATAFMYYHGGSNRDIWGPRTRRYAEDMAQRTGGMSGGGGAPPPPPMSEPQISATRITSAGGNRPGRFRTAAASELPAGVRGAQIDTMTGQLTNIVRTPTSSRSGAAGGAETATQLRDRRQQESQLEAQQGTSNILRDMAEQYVTLSDMDGAIVDSRRGAGNNIEAWVNSSSLGQAMGGAFGSEAQSIRQQINQSRPLLLNQVRQASEMGARGLDSNKELEFYLQAATDPGRELIANFAAIHILDTAYGTGDSLAQALPPELFEIVSRRAVGMAGENDSGYLFQNTGQSPKASVASTGWGQARVVE